MDSSRFPKIHSLIWRIMRGERSRKRTPHCPEEFDHRTSPPDLEASPRRAQFETQPDHLMEAQSNNRLVGNALVIQVTNNSAIGFVEDDVGQCAQVVPMVGSRLPRE